MAKSNSFFGLRRGSTKTLTFQVLSGKQITKDRVTEVKNPRSSSQMHQRMRNFSTVKAYGLLKPICDHSWENVPYGMRSYSEFLSRNYKNMVENPDLFAYSTYQSRFSAPGAFSISDGSLLPITRSWNSGNDNINGSGLLNADGTGTLVAKATGSPADLTMADAANFLGLDRADLLTIVAPKWRIEGNAVTGQELIIIRVSKSSMFDENAAWSNANFFNNFDVQTNSDSDGLIVEGGNINITAQGDLLGDGVYQPFATILSQKTNSGWKRSPATLPVQNLYNYITGEAFSTYPIGTERILNGGDGYGLGEQTPEDRLKTSVKATKVGTQYAYQATTSGTINVTYGRAYYFKQDGTVDSFTGRAYVPEGTVLFSNSPFFVSVYNEDLGGAVPEIDRLNFAGAAAISNSSVIYDSGNISAGSGYKVYGTDGEVTNATELPETGIVFYTTEAPAPPEP